ncbi:GTP cyclohydrolase, partial [Butyricicoccus sp. 1XD8-22]
MNNLLINKKEILLNKMNIVPFNKNQNLCLVGPVKLPVKQGDFEATFKWYTWLKIDGKLTKEEVLDLIANANLADQQQSSVLVYGDFEAAEDAIIRMHSICHTGDIFGSMR